MEESFQNLTHTSVAQREYSPSPNSKKPNRFLFLLLFIGSVGLLLFLGKTFFYKNAAVKKETEVTPVPTIEQAQEVQPTEAPAAIALATPSVTTPRPTINPVDKVTGLDRSELSIVVRNGSGEVGAASKASDILKELGYHVVSVGNADNFDYQDIQIEINSTKNQFLSLLKKDLGLSYTIGSTSATLSASASADAVVTVGK